MFSAPTLAFAPLAQSRGIVVLSPTAGAEAVPKVGPLVFSLYPTARLEGQYMASYLAEHLSGEAPVVVVGAQEEVYQSIVQGFVDRLRQFGSLKIAMVESAPPETRNFRDIIAKFARPGPAPILYVAGSKTFVATLVAQAKQSGFNGRIFSQSTLYDPSLGRDFGEVLEGMTFTGPFYQPESMDEPIPEFVSRYKQHYGSVPDVWAAYGYDAVLAIATVLKDCSTCQGSSMAARLRSLSIKGTTGPIQFDQEGAASRAFRLFVFQQGVIKRAD
jgi:branched-chain amino acid transport system substrate-binding protein